MRIVERIGGHYEAQEVAFGMVYTWRPESVVAECECGQRATFKRSDVVGGSVIACECGLDPMTRTRDELIRDPLYEQDKDVHPWHYWSKSRDNGLPF